jgi:hypothetical protein
MPPSFIPQISFTYPAISMPRGAEGGRLLILHKNVPNILSSITTHISSEGINIDNMANRSKGDYAVTMVDTPDHVGDEIIAKITDMENVIRVWIFAHLKKACPLTNLSFSWLHEFSPVLSCCVLFTKETSVISFPDLLPMFRRCFLGFFWFFQALAC